MTRERVPETDHGIQGEFNVEIYDQMQRRLRDKGWMETHDIIKSGIARGFALEIGPGPGYLGLEWLKNTEETTLKGVDISPDMLTVAERNAGSYGLLDRVKYAHTNGSKLLFDDGTFDAVFTASSLHEWAEPTMVLNEIWRVLKVGGRLWISDFRRDMSPLIKWLLWLNARPRSIRKGLLTSLNAAYAPGELQAMLLATKLSSCEISAGPMSLKITGIKK